jgi:hypothetical protein
VSATKLLVIGLVLVLALSCVAIVACGGKDDAAAKTELRNALDKVQVDIDELTTAVMTGATVADVKASVATFQPDWDAVVAACGDVEGADAAQAQTIWDDLVNGLNAVPDDGDAIALGQAMAAPKAALDAFIAELQALVGTGDDATTDSTEAATATTGAAE